MTVILYGDSYFVVLARRSDYLVTLADGACYKLLFINKIIVDEMSPYVCIVYVM